MKSPLLLSLALFTLLPLAACQDGDITEPAVQELSLEDEIALELLQNPATTEAALEMAGIQTSAAHRWGWRWGGQDDHGSQAENCFRQAQHALANGDPIRAMEHAREGRRLVAQSIELAGGSNAIVGMVERLEALPLAVTADQDLFVNSGKLGLQLGQLAVMARQALQKGDRTRAGALGVLAEQALRHNHRYQNQVGVGRPEVKVALGAEAIELAEGLLGQQDPGADAEQLELLATAMEFQAGAEAALDLGEGGRAAHLAHQAQWWALKAVVLPGGITDEEAESLLGLATSLLESAQTAIGDDPTELQASLLARAGRMLEMGQANSGNGTCRGIGALWQTAVISSYLVP